MYSVRFRVRVRLINDCEITYYVPTAARIKTSNCRVTIFKLVKKMTIQYEVAVRARLNIETLNLILKLQSAVFLDILQLHLWVRIRFLGPIFDIFFCSV